MKSVFRGSLDLYIVCENRIKNDQRDPSEKFPSLAVACILFIAYLAVSAFVQSPSGLTSRLRVLQGSGSFSLSILWFLRQCGCDVLSACLFGLLLKAI
jgi:hypothetical protein